jgi:hypothetical protein
MAIINQFSFVISAVLTGAILAVVLWRWKRLPLPVWLRVVMLALYIVGAIALGLSRRYPDSSVTTLAEAEARLTNEQPTFVMLYSNY